MPANPSADAVLQDLRAGSRPITANEVRTLTKFLGPGGKRKDITAIYRLFDRGSRRADGTRLPLPSAIGPSGTKVTTMEAIDRWLAALNGTTITVEAKTQKAHADAERRLAAAGL